MNTNCVKIIETEIVRKMLYNSILEQVYEKLKLHLQIKEIQHLLLRYIFNKIIQRTANDDPIFIPRYSAICQLQIERDFKFKSITINQNEFISFLDQLLLDAHNKLQLKINSNEIPNDSNVVLDHMHNSLIYRNFTYKNISNLATSHNSNLHNYCVALNIRYTYLHLSTHGLARDYSRMGYKPSDGLEMFASAFNHYFYLYHSAFPDLETPFGSIGSFFESIDQHMLNQCIDIVIQSLKNENIVSDFTNFTNFKFVPNIYNHKHHKSTKQNQLTMFVNPPFDELLMSIVFFIYHHLQLEHKTILTAPNWDNFLFLDYLKKYKETKTVNIYKKGTLWFINHMNNKRIGPCDIAEIVIDPTL
jgi:hypothetical protein